VEVRSAEVLSEFGSWRVSSTQITWNALIKSGAVRRSSGPFGPFRRLILAGNLSIQSISKSIMAV
jgi:hypothetical protein